MPRLSLLLATCAVTQAWHTMWNSRPSWYDESKEANYNFPLSTETTEVLDYAWDEKDQRAQLVTSNGGLLFRRYISAEVFGAQLAEYLDICVYRARYIPYGSDTSNAWQDKLQDVQSLIPGEDEERVQYLFEDKVGVQEVEYVEGANLKDYVAPQGYNEILFDIGKIMALDIFINDVNNCRYCACSDCENPCDAHKWTCDDQGGFNFVISPTRGVCGFNRAFNPLEIDSLTGRRFQQFFSLAKSCDTSTELAKHLAYVAGEIFGENLTIDRREAAKEMLKGARFVLDRLVELTGSSFKEITTTSGLHPSNEFGLGERLRMLKIIYGKDPVQEDIVEVLGLDPNIEVATDIETDANENAQIADEEEDGNVEDNPVLMEIPTVVPPTAEEQAALDAAFECSDCDSGDGVPQATKPVFLEVWEDDDFEDPAIVEELTDEVFDAFLAEDDAEEAAEDDAEEAEEDDAEEAEEDDAEEAADEDDAEVKGEDAEEGADEDDAVEEAEVAEDEAEVADDEAEVAKDEADEAEAAEDEVEVAEEADAEEADEDEVEEADEDKVEEVEEKGFFQKIASLFIETEEFEDPVLASEEEIQQLLNGGDPDIRKGKMGPTKVLSPL